MEEKINYLAMSHKGIMPIRVLQNNLINEFEGMNADFLDLSRGVINNEGADPAIGYVAEEEKVKSPYVLFNKINLNEAFLSYIWSNCYSLLVLYREVVVKKSYNEFHGVAEKVTDPVLAGNAYRLWEYAMSLIVSYTPWDTALPNPEVVESSQVDLILRVNSLYLKAMTFVLAHEFAHIELGHAESTLDNEKAADQRAIDLVMQGITPANRETKVFGVLMGLCCLLFLSASTTSANYPDMDDRIDAILQGTAPDEANGMWGIAILAYKLWDQLYNVGLTWEENLGSPKDLYYNIKEQIKRRSRSPSYLLEVRGRRQAIHSE